MKLGFGIFGPSRYTTMKLFFRPVLPQKTGFMYRVKLLMQMVLHAFMGTITQDSLALLLKDITECTLTKKYASSIYSVIVATIFL